MITAFLSVAGAPGVTTAAVAATAQSVRSTYLLEADTSKASDVITGYLEGLYDSSRGLSHCVAASHRNSLSPEFVLQQQTITLPGENKWLIPGFDSVQAGQRAGKIWTDLATIIPAIARTGPDIMIDFGRWRAQDPRTPLLDVADVIVLMLRPRLPEVVTAMNHLDYLTLQLAEVGARDRLSAVIIGTPEKHYTARAVEKQLGVPVIATLPFHSDTASAFSLGTVPKRRLDRQPYVRAVTAMLTAIHDHHRRVQETLTLEAS